MDNVSRGRKKSMIYSLFPTLILILFFTIPYNAFASTNHSFGLKFLSHEVSRELRTSLDLSPDNSLKLPDQFELSFDFSLNPGHEMYFGYILRVIDNEAHNIDLIFNYLSSTQNSFEIIYSQGEVNKSFTPDFHNLLNDWSHLRLIFDLKTQRLSFCTPDTIITLNEIKINNELKFVFGASEFSNFKSTDVPPMNIKNIQISSGNKIINHWPLNENNGLTAQNTINKFNGSVKNPVWLKPLHSNWAQILQLNFNGLIEYAYNQESETLYLINNLNVFSFSINTQQLDTLFVNHEKMSHDIHNSSIYDSKNHRIISYNADLNSISFFDLDSNHWQYYQSKDQPLTDYLHHNEYFHGESNSLYLFGGYGHYEYKNIIKTHSFEKKSWDLIRPNSNWIEPRYLASMGQINDSLFILGGYGSNSGKQILNPLNYYDLWCYSITNNTFSKIYEFDTPIEDMVLANSMIIDKETRSFYALGFSFFKFQNKIQLIQGSLDNPSFQILGNSIPYLFHDVISSADLFKAPFKNKLVAITIFYNDNHESEVSVNTIRLPVNKAHKVQVAPKSRIENTPIFYILIIISLSIVAIIYYKRKNKKNDADELDSILIDNTASEEMIVETKEEIKNSIFLFGDLQVFDNKGIDITNKYSPLLKELFLLILFHSIKTPGISSERLKEILWFDKDEQSAKNNLGVNIAKIKQLSSELDSMEVSRQTGYWKINFDEQQLYIDYIRCLNIVQNSDKLSQPQLQELLSITNKGLFLTSCAFDWLDDFKSEISNKIIDAFLLYTEKMDLKKDSDTMIKIADAIFNFDLMNEDAVYLKCKALTIQRKHNLAKESYSKFTKSYEEFYNVGYPKAYSEFIKGK